MIFYRIIMTKMQLNPQKGIGLVGLGKMGTGIGNHLDELGYRVVGFDVKESRRDEVSFKEGEVVDSINEMAEALPAPRVVWVMVPHEAVDEVLNELVSVLDPGDVIVEAGNSYFRNTVDRAERLLDNSIHLVDAGVSGGPSGARDGAAIMVGGDPEVCDDLSALFADLAVPGGYDYMGESGAGHFTKMVHNGIEYGMLQSIAEGMELLREGPYEDIDIDSAAEVYGNGSVIQSQLIDFLGDAFEDFGTDLEEVSSTVDAGGTGHWALKEAKEADAPYAALGSAVDFRDKSKESRTYAGKVINALRHMFGGHEVFKNKSDSE